MPSHTSGIHQDGVLKSSYLWNHHTWIGGCQSNNLPLGKLSGHAMPLSNMVGLEFTEKKTSSHCLPSSNLWRAKTRDADAISRPCCRYSSWNPEGFQFNDLVWQPAPNETITAAVNLSLLRRGVEISRQWSRDRLKRSLMRLIILQSNCSLDIIQYRCSDWWDVQATCLGIRGKCRYEYIFQCLWFGLWRIEKTSAIIYRANTLVQECG